MYQNLLPLWRTNEELMITAWEGLGFTNNYNLRRNSYVKGSRHYELSNHTSTLLSAGLGNVLAVVSDRKIEHDERYAFAVGGGYKYENGAYHLDAAGSFAQLSAADGIISSYVAEVISATDYYAFGAPMPSRSWQGGEYRFGFNGQEKDNEVAGTGNIMTAEFWEYDARLGRRWNMDPVLKVELSSFGCFSNNPITRIDPKGDDDFFDAKGNLVLHTNTGNSVFIIDCSLKEFVEAHYRATLKYKEINLQSAYLRAYGTSVEKVKLNGDPKDPNTIAINNIIWHYFKKAKVDEINVTRFGFGSIDDKTLAQTGSSLGGIDFNLINSSLHPLLNTSNNITNVLVHERYHNWGDKKSGPNESINHLNAYIAQMGHKSWGGTTQDFKTAHYNAFMYYLQFGNEAQKKDFINQLENTIGGTLEKNKEGNYELIQKPGKTGN